MKPLAYLPLLPTVMLAHCGPGTLGSSASDNPTTNVPEERTVDQDNHCRHNGVPIHCGQILVILGTPRERFHQSKSRLLEFFGSAGGREVRGFERLNHVIMEFPRDADLDALISQAEELSYVRRAHANYIIELYD